MKHISATNMQKKEEAKTKFNLEGGKHFFTPLVKYLSFV